MVEMVMVKVNDSITVLNYYNFADKGHGMGPQDRLDNSFGRSLAIELNTIEHAI